MSPASPPRRRLRPARLGGAMTVTLPASLRLKAVITSMPVHKIEVVACPVR